MGFYSFSFGCTLGIGVAMSVKPLVYYTIAEHLYYPHKRYYRFRKSRDWKVATSPEEIEQYALSVIKSFATFWLIIGPVL